MDLDDLDKAFVNTIVPEDCVTTGFFAIVTWLTPEGRPVFQFYNQSDTDRFVVVGMLETVKHVVLQEAFEADETDDIEDGTDG